MASLDREPGREPDLTHQGASPASGDGCWKVDDRVVRTSHPSGSERPRDAPVGLDIRKPWYDLGRRYCL